MAPAMELASVVVVTSEPPCRRRTSSKPLGMYVVVPVTTRSAWKSASSVAELSAFVESPAAEPDAGAFVSPSVAEATETSEAVPDVTAASARELPACVRRLGSVVVTSVTV